MHFVLEYVKLYTLGFEHVGRHVGHLVYLHVDHHVQLHVGQLFFLTATMSATLSTPMSADMCTSMSATTMSSRRFVRSRTLTEWKSESIMDDDGRTDGPEYVLHTLVCLKSAIFLYRWVFPLQSKV